MKINDIQPFLFEGIKFGQKEISDILSRSDDFNVGIEYEFRPTEEQKDNLEDWLQEYNVRKSITNMVAEHDDMLELVTKKMSVADAISHLSNMFKLISDKEIEVPSMAGLHISISTNKYNLEDINMSKFLVLMNAEYLHGLFPERKHTQSIADRLLKNVNIKFDKFTKEVVRDIEEQIEKNVGEKHQTIKISDYTTVDMSGRIELRFFGGENYHKQLDVIKQELLRALFILEIAYTDLHQKQYYRELYDLLLSSNKKLIKKVTNDPESIRDIKNPSEDIQLAAVKKNSDVIQYIKNPSENAKLLAVKSNGSNIRYIDNPSEDLQLAAVNEDGYAIRYIIKKDITPSEEVQLAAVNEDGYTIKYIFDKGITPSEEVQQAAVNENGLAIQYIIAKGIEPSEEVKLAAVRNNTHAIKYIDKPSEDVQLAVIERRAKLYIAMLLKKDIELTDKAKLKILQYKADYMEDLEYKYGKFDDDFYKKAIEINPKVYNYIESPSDKINKFYLENNSSAILESDFNNKEMRDLFLDLTKTKENYLAPLINLFFTKSRITHYFYENVLKNVDDKKVIEFFNTYMDDYIPKGGLYIDSLAKLFEKFEDNKDLQKKIARIILGKLDNSEESEKRYSYIHDSIFPTLEDVDKFEVYLEKGHIKTVSKSIITDYEHYNENQKSFLEEYFSKLENASIAAEMLENAIGYKRFDFENFISLGILTKENIELVIEEILNKYSWVLVSEAKTIKEILERLDIDKLDIDIEEEHVDFSNENASILLSPILKKFRSFPDKITKRALRWIIEFTEITDIDEMNDFIENKLNTDKLFNGAFYPLSDEMLSYAKEIGKKQVENNKER